MASKFPKLFQYNSLRPRTHCSAPVIGNNLQLIEDDDDDFGQSPETTAPTEISNKSSSCTSKIW